MERGLVLPRIILSLLWKNREEKLEQEEFDEEEAALKRANGRRCHGKV